MALDGDRALFSHIGKLLHVTLRIVREEDVGGKKKVNNSVHGL